MGKAEIWNFSTSLQLDISQVSAVIFHILHARKIDYKIPRKKPQIFPPADSCAKYQ